MNRKLLITLAAVLLGVFSTPRADAVGALLVAALMAPGG